MNMVYGYGAVWCLVLTVASLIPSGSNLDTEDLLSGLPTAPPLLQYDQLLAEFWRWRLRESPEFATTVGVSLHDARLETFTMQAFDHRKAKCEKLVSQIDRLVTTTRLTRGQFDNLVLLRGQLTDYINGFRWRHYGTYNPINNIEGVHKDYTYWLDAMNFDQQDAFLRYIDRLRALATQINEQINLMRQGMDIGWTNHKVSMDTIPLVLHHLDRPAKWTPFYRPFNDSMQYIDASRDRKEQLMHEGEMVIMDHVTPAYRKLSRFLREEYLPQTRTQVSVSTLPGGLHYYRACLEWYLSYSVDPLILHRLALRVVASIVAKIEELKRSVSYIGQYQDFIKYVQRGPKFFFKTEGEIWAYYREVIHRRVPPLLGKLFHNVTTTNRVKIQRMLFDGPAGVLVPGSEDGVMPEVFFINVNQPLKRLKWQMATLALHETLPGRQLQMAYEKSLNMPKFRKYREFRKMYAVPFQFPFYTAYTEGWSIYAESLGHDMGLFVDPFDGFGQLFSELYKACEMVVDTGIHAAEWSQADAVSYILSHTSLPYQKIVDDVTRIITIPGQAAAPEYGYLKLKELRRKAKSAFGGAFDIRDFHHRILKMGPVPLNLMERDIMRWIQENTKRSSYQKSSSGSPLPQPSICGVLIHVVLVLTVVFTNTAHIYTNHIVVS